MTEQLTGLWGKVGGRCAYDMDKMINRNRKAAKRELSEHEANMRAYASQRSLQKVKKILTTEEEAINRVISSVIDQANASGMSVVNTRRLLVDSLEGDEMMTIENWQAQRIALTEVNSAGNYGSFEELRMEGVKGQKSWITSGRSNVRDSHREHESLGWVDSDYDYATNLQFPGDPDCDIAEEVCNCHCTYLFEIED